MVHQKFRIRWMGSTRIFQEDQRYLETQKETLTFFDTVRQRKFSTSSGDTLRWVIEAFEPDRQATSTLNCSQFVLFPSMKFPKGKESLQ